MKIDRLFKFAAALLFAGLLTSFTGCAKRGYHTGERTATNLQAMATKVEMAGRQMDIAVTELDSLVNSPQPDLRPQFDRFSAAVGQLSTLATNLAKAGTELQSRSRLHAESWDKELVAIQNEEIRASAKARKQEVASRFENVRAACQSVQTAIGPVQSDLLDVQRYLNSDLTMGGLSAIKDTATRVGRNAGPARESVTKLVTELRGLGVAMAPQNSAAPAPAAVK
ncbi:MAG: DUF2959 family protein [Verrucomicrobiota bacterium]